MGSPFATPYVCMYFKWQKGVYSVSKLELYRFILRFAYKGACVNALVILDRKRKVATRVVGDTDKLFPFSYHQNLLQATLPVQPILAYRISQSHLKSDTDSGSSTGPDSELVIYLRKLWKMRG